MEKIESINNPVEMIINIPVIIKLVSGQNAAVKRQKVVAKRVIWTIDRGRLKVK